MKLTRMVDEWFLAEMDALPARDPNRTAECLSFGEIESAARQPDSVSAPQLAHIIECSWCRRNWLTFKTLQKSSVSSPHFASPLPAEASSASWTPEYGERVSQYLTSASYLAHENSELVPARFDEEGVLRLNWSGLLEDGPVSVSLFIDGIEQILAQGYVSDGQLEIVQPLAELGQRSIELPASVLRLHPLAVGR